MARKKTEIYTRFENGKNWKREEGHFRNFPEYDRFLAGNQWPKGTVKTQHMPRPVLNIMKRIGSFKVSSVMRQPLKAIFTPQEVSTLTEDKDEQRLLEIGKILGLYIDTLRDRLDEEKTDEIILTKSMTVGAGFAHTFWNNEIIRGNNGDIVGELEREIIDSLNVYLDNPQEENIQKQQRVRIIQPKLVSELQQMAKELGKSQDDIDSIVSDEKDDGEKYDKQTNENDNGLKADFITEYEVRRVQVDTDEDEDIDPNEIRVVDDNGETQRKKKQKWETKVFWTKATKTLIFQEDIELKGHKLIPISSCVWDRRNFSAYGTSEIGHLIPNQKAINFLIAMMLLSAQSAGWPTLVVDDKAVKTNITNDPSAVHRVDTTKTGGNVANAMRYLDSGTFANQIFSVVDSLVNYTKDFAGASESALGESKDLSGQAINRLQTASAIPLETNKRNFRDYKKQNARIDSEFFMHNYTKRDLMFKNKDGQMETFNFDPEEIAGARFDIGIDIGTDTEYSAELSEASLKGLLDQGLIDLKQFLNHVDPKVAPYATKMLDELKELEEKGGMGDNIADVIEQMKEMDPNQLAEFMTQDMDQIMTFVNQILGGAEDEVQAV